jgi:hypothetical protein
VPTTILRREPRRGIVAATEVVHLTLKLLS